MITKYTNQEVLIESKNIDAINAMISAKQIALAEAIENVDFFTKRNMLEHASTEKVRVERLQKDILKLTVN